MRQFRLPRTIRVVTGLIASLMLSAPLWAQTAIRINAGGSAYTDAARNVWAADSGYGGNTYTVDWGNTPIGGTSDPALYRNERYGDLHYAFAVPNGTYQLKLYFAENYVNSSFPHGGVGYRLITANAEGVRLFTNLDVFATVGAHQALIKTYTVTVQDGRLNLDFASATGGFVNAIEIVGSTVAAPVAAPKAAFTPKIIFRFPKTQEAWDQAMESPAGSVIFPIYNPNFVGLDLTRRDPLIDRNIATAQSYGLKVFAYIDGRDSEASSDVIQADINTWVNQLAAVGEHIDGVFIGNAGLNKGVGDGKTYPSYWIDLVNWVHNTYNVPVFIHPGGSKGTSADVAQILTVADSVMMYEYYVPLVNGLLDLPSVDAQLPQELMSKYDRSRFSAVANGVSLGNLQNMESFFLNRNIGYLYITDVDYGPADADDYWYQETSRLGN